MVRRERGRDPEREYGSTDRSRVPPFRRCTTPLLKEKVARIEARATRRTGQFTDKNRDKPGQTDQDQAPILMNWRRPMPQAPFIYYSGASTPFSTPIATRKIPSCAAPNFSHQVSSAVRILSCRSEVVAYSRTISYTGSPCASASPM